MKKRVYLYSTSVCNHCCKHCYLGFSGSFDPQELLQIVMSLREQYEIVISGAEPLTDFRYLASYEAAGQHMIYSNGIVFTGKGSDNAVSELKAHHIDTVRISHHFSAIKELNAVPSETVAIAISNLQANNITVQLHTTITATNCGEIEEICQYAVDHNIHRIKFFLLRKVGKAKNSTNILALTELQTEEVYKEICRLRTIYPIDKLKIKIDGDLHRLADKFCCTYGKNDLSITPDRKIYGCPFAVGNQKPIGYLTPDHRIEITDYSDHDGSTCQLVQD